MSLIQTSASTVPGLIARRADEAPDEQFMVCDEKSIGCAELDRRSRAVAQRLLRSGVGKGDRVGLMMPNGIDWAVAAFGALRAGATLVPLSTLLRPPELLAQLNAGDVTALFTVRTYRTRNYIDELASVLPGVADRPVPEAYREAPALRRVWVWGETLSDEPVDGDPLPEPVVRPSDDMVVLFTSGSRGAPKGTIHTHGSALRAVASSLAVRCVVPGDRLYIPMPFFWAGGLASGLLTCLVGRVVLLTETAPEPASTVRFLERERATLFRGWPAQAARIAADPTFAPTALPCLRPGSLDAVLPPALRAGPGARAALFGMSETFGPYAGFPLDTDMPEGKFGSCGKPVDGVEVRIVDPDTREPVPAGTNGEILVRGPNVMRGIHGRERHEVFDADGYYPTGDIGSLDADGFLWFQSRRDDMFKVSGATVYPTEVERGLLGVPGVSQAFVTAVESDGVPAVGAAVVGADLDLAAVAAGARTQLSSFKVPTVWLLLRDKADVPRLASEKPDVLELRRRLTEHGVRADR